jgi:hypothetical protein
MPTKIEIPPDLPKIRILDTELSEQEVVITFESTREWAICAKCGAEIREFHSPGGQLRSRHPPTLGRSVIIEIRPKHLRCPTGDKNPTTTQKLDWYDERGLHTKAYDQWLPPQLIGGTITDVARKEEIIYDAALGAARRQIAAEISWEQIEQLEMLGLNQIVLKKGRREFVVLVTTRQTQGN